MDAEFPRVTYEDDILFIEFSDAPAARTREAGSVWVNVDEAEDGSIVAIKFVDASTGVDLRYVPRRDEIEALIRSLNVPVRV